MYVHKCFGYKDFTCMMARVSYYGVCNVCI
jgi:hypothetical protein